MPIINPMLQLPPFNDPWWQTPLTSELYSHMYAERKAGTFVGPPEKPVDWDAQVYMDESNPLHEFRNDLVNQIGRCKDGNGYGGFSWLDARGLAKSIEALIDAKIAAVTASAPQTPPPSPRPRSDSNASE